MGERWSNRTAQILLLTEVLRGMGWRPFRSELCVFHCGLAVAGQIDAIFVNEAGDSFCLVDWKNCRDVRFDSFQRSLREPLSHLEDSNGWHYALQLNVYRRIVGAEYGLCVGEHMYLAIVHPTLSKPRLLQVPRLDAEIQLLIEDQVSMDLAVCAAMPSPDAQFAIP